jgi:hypothetical protein
MQAQPGVRAQMYNSHQHSASASTGQNHNHTNGVHSNSPQYYSTSTNGNSNARDMHPYQSHHPYAFGHVGQGQPQQQQYQPNQLPPMGVPPPMAPSAAPPMQGPGPGVSSTTLLPAAPGLITAPANPERASSPYSGNNGKYKFELRVEQQPQRARMCGFGDKDRRPITPPPCVRLIITDLRTGEQIKPDEYEGQSMFFVLQVDLWDEAGTREVNLVRSSSASPAVSISTATTTSYPPTTPDRPLPSDYPPTGMYAPPDAHQMYAPPGYPMGMVRPPLPGAGFPNQGYYPPNAYPNIPGPFAQAPPPQTAPQHHSNFNRNLIGSVAVNASVLKDTQGNEGYWFVLQDLSVRTEGHFR